jgi:CheY-like chemotaxis protein
MTEVANDVASLAALKGLHVLVVEDNGLLCCVLEESLHEAGCEVVGPFARLTEALDAVPDAQIDIAVLDLNIRGELVSPLAEELSQRGVPFVLTSGYQGRDIPRSLQGARQLRKPYTTEDVLEQLAAVVAENPRNMSAR